MEWVITITAVLALLLMFVLYRSNLRQQAEHCMLLLAEADAVLDTTVHEQVILIGHWLNDQAEGEARYAKLMNEHELLAQQHCAAEAAYAEAKRNEALFWTLATHLFETQKERIMDLESKTLDAVHANWPPTTAASYPPAPSYWWLADDQDQIIYPAGYAIAVEAITSAEVTEILADPVITTPDCGE